MPLPPEGVLALCQRVETMLQEVEQRVRVPRPEILAECEHELGRIAALLESLHKSMIDSGTAATQDRSASSLPHDNPAVRQTLRQIQNAARKLKAQFEYGSNYCRGLLQIRLGTGYSERGLPVLTPAKARSSFEG